MIPDDYKASCEKIAKELEITSDEVYDCIKHIDINWVKSLFDPFENPIVVTFDMPVRYNK
jgi:hypothetical protein